MRLAVLIIGLCVAAAIAIQSGFMFLSPVLRVSDDGVTGLIISSLYLVGSAFIFGVPRASQIAFGLAAILSYLQTLDPTTSAPYVWCGIAVALTFLSYLGLRERRRLAISQ